MVRNLVLLGVAAAFALAIPAFYEANPALFQRGPADAQPHRPPLQPVSQEAPADLEVMLGRKVRLTADSRGHYVAEFKLNGRRVEALIDTGATLVAINRSTARRIGISLVPADFIHQVNTANGATRAAAASIDRLQIGRIHVEDVQAVVLDDRALQGTLIGMSFLNQLGRFGVENGALLMEQ